MATFVKSESANDSQLLGVVRPSGTDGPGDDAAIVDTTEGLQYVRTALRLNVI